MPRDADTAAATAFSSKTCKKIADAGLGFRD